MSGEMEVLHDSEVALVSEGGSAPGRLVAEFSDTEYTVRISYSGKVVEATAWNLFEALADVRRELEREGLKPAVEGACRDVYPSRMALEMGGGRKAYRWPLADRPVTVGIFDAVPDDECGRLAYVGEQRDFVRRLGSKGHE
ncbi:hypothetical protein AB0D66_31230 [Streptomyces sp. NPDC048270]|uniref:hypothetical protein n=1 Tax=Streptomyces sp. NPDC048270 TaxID=3154615 RepID=UPI0033FDF47D